MATAQPHLITADEFLAIEWDDSDVKAELSNGVIRIIRMMAGGNADHSRVQVNVLTALRNKLKGTGCRPHGPDMAVFVDDFSIRYPDVSVYCGRDTPEFGKRQAFDDPKLLVEVLSPTTRAQDFEVKLPEYMQLPSVDAILFIDPEAETVRLWRRVGHRLREAPAFAPGDVIELASLQISLLWQEIFTRD